MTKEHAYAYESGYQDGLRMAKTDKDNLTKELEAEHALAETLGHYYELAQTENAKLRKLVMDWYRLYRDHEEMSFKDSLGTEVVLFQRMQELGVMDE